MASNFESAFGGASELPGIVSRSIRSRFVAFAKAVYLGLDVSIISYCDRRTTAKDASIKSQKAKL
jgi:hypothetical protein